MIKATIPYIKQDVPIWIVFRALGVLSDRDILEHICYDMQDLQMLEMLKPCIDEGFAIQEREVRICLPFSRPFHQINIKSLTASTEFHRRAWYYHRSLQRPPSAVRTRDSPKRDAAPRCHDRGLAL